MDIREKIEQLIQELNQASQAYYNGQTELMSDFEWDQKFDTLKQLEEESGIILENSPTQIVSKDAIAGEKEAHEFDALSLAKTKQPAALVKWAEGKAIWLSWKLDGLTLVVTYQNGILQKVVTRGDGHIGTNITHLAKAIIGIPEKIAYQGKLILRGEAVISYADFQQFMIESGEDYANPRNLASGSLSLKDIEEVKKRKIHWIVFSFVYGDQDFDTVEQQIHLIQENGFTFVDHTKITDPTLENVEKVIDDYSQIVTAGQNPYPVDGLVICYDDVAFSRSGSVTGHHATRGGYAFKWQDEPTLSTLDHIEWSCAVSIITPVAVFEPVAIEGTMVKRASLCNISECKRLGIGGTGSKIKVIKANKIIPKVIGVEQAVGEFEIPEFCPVCHSQTEVQQSSSSGTETLHCINPDCPAKQLKKFSRFVSKAGMDIDGISEATLSKFISFGWIGNYGDIYRLDQHHQEIQQLDGFGEKSAKNILDSIAKSRTVAATKLLFALNIPLVGVDVVKKLLAHYSFEELVDIAQKEEDLSYFSHIDGIGKEKSSSFMGWFKVAKNLHDLQDVLQYLNIEQPQQQPSGARCEGLTFVVTGDVYQFANRNELKAYIESQGGKVTGSVSKATNFLINNDQESTSSKNMKAKQLGIEIISEQQFIERFQR